MKVKVVYDSPIPAPIQQGQQVARLVLDAPDTQPIEVPLMAAQDVARLGVVGRLVSGVKFLIFGSP